MGMSLNGTVMKGQLILAVRLVEGHAGGHSFLTPDEIRLPKGATQIEMALISLPGYGLPSFQFASGGAPLVQVRGVNAVLGASSFPAASTIWWFSENLHLANSRPIDLLGQNRGAQLISAAIADLRAVSQN